MFLIDDLLILVVKAIHKKIDTELNNPTHTQEQILALQLRFELDEINEKEYNEQMEELTDKLDRLRQQEEEENQSNQKITR